MEDGAPDMLSSNHSALLCPFRQGVDGPVNPSLPNPVTPVTFCLESLVGI